MDYHQLAHVVTCAVWLLERAVVLAILACIVVLAVLGLGFYALHKIKPGWLRIQAGVWRLITFSMEIGQPGVPEKPRHERSELERGKTRELEAGRGNDSSASSALTGDVGQGDTAVLWGLTAMARW